MMGYGAVTRGAMVELDLTIDSSSVLAAAPHQEQKKADVAEHLEVFGHVGLLVNEPLGTAGLLFI